MNKLIILMIAALTFGAAAQDNHRKDDKPALSVAGKVLKKIKSADTKAKRPKGGGKHQLPPALAKFDKNKDGKLSDAERKVARAAFVKRFDKNKDGKLDKKERAAAMKERRKHAIKPKGKGKQKPAPKKG